MQIGSDTYGRVKVVGGTSIVTQFFMLNGFPVYPLRSFFFLGGETTTTIPFVLSETKIHGVPLARVDRSSAAVAYARGIFGALLVVGICGFIFWGITMLTSAVVPDAAVWAGYALAGAAAIGGVGGAASYMFPRVALRERVIRELCGEHLGLCIDPAAVTPDLAASLQLAEEMDGVSSEADRRRNLLQKLIVARCKIALSNEVAEAERLTDHYVQELRRLSGSSAS